MVGFVSGHTVFSNTPVQVNHSCRDTETQARLDETNAVMNAMELLQTREPRSMM